MSPRVAFGAVLNEGSEVRGRFLKPIYLLLFERLQLRPNDISLAPRRSFSSTGWTTRTLNRFPIEPRIRKRSPSRCFPRKHLTVRTAQLLPHDDRILPGPLTAGSPTRETKERNLFNAVNRETTGRSDRRNFLDSPGIELLTVGRNKGVEKAGGKRDTRSKRKGKKGGSQGRGDPRDSGRC